MQCGACKDRHDVMEGGGGRGGGGEGRRGGGRGGGGGGVGGGGGGEGGRQLGSLSICYHVSMTTDHASC